ncbi:NAD(P)-binding domain-containing protein [Nesterenkonia sp. MY13]|uniref:NAD(P)-binding domain-containing protein n=1 Tax=Nesterenkonia sedimenti TaxID=1463632 RepID=A0A7X8YEH1_9MICC|nr:NAD(P)-binding domain-containing protein [Nesterenkonia sedimenti]NLS10629.1 NAD(P)-binding domain-containing protein [Nesterenkonia sedimenti]
MTSQQPVIVIGAGPIGLAAAAHMLEYGLEPLVLESGEHAGAAISQWGHIQLFSPWRYNIDAACRRLLEETDWQEPNPGILPTGAQLVEEYLKPIAAANTLDPRIRYRTRVVSVLRRQDSFLVRTETDGEVLDFQASAVIDASGTWHTPNPLGAGGLPAAGENDDALAPHLLGPLPDVLGADRHRVAGRRALVVGSGHSAVNTLLNLVALRREVPSTSIQWAIRSADPQRSYGGEDRDGLPERGALGTQLRQSVEAGQIELLTSAEVQALESVDGDLEASFQDGRGLRVDALAAATGFRPDLEILRGLRLELDPTVEAPVRLAPLIDPAVHSCGTVRAHGAAELAHPEEGFFIVGMKSYGRAPTFLMATGYEQVRSVAAYLAGADASPRDLNLPATGVCSAG